MNGVEVLLLAVAGVLALVVAISKRRSRPERHPPYSGYCANCDYHFADHRYGRCRAFAGEAWDGSGRWHEGMRFRDQVDEELEWPSRDPGVRPAKQIRQADTFRLDF